MLSSIRSSRPGVFFKKGVLRNFAKFTGKHLYQSLFFNKLEGIKSASSLKKRLWRSGFPVDFANILRTPFLQNSSARLLPANAVYESFFDLSALNSEKTKSAKHFFSATYFLAD